MAATISVVYPHNVSIGGDGFWLIREPGGTRAGDRGLRLRRRGRVDRRLPRARLRRRSAARAEGGADRSRRDRRLGAGARTFARARRPAAAGAAARRRRAARARRLSGLGLRGALRSATSDPELVAAPGFAEAFMVDGKPRRGRRDPPRAAARRHARTARRAPASTISIAATSRARSPPISSASARRSRAPTSSAIAPHGASRCRCG